MIELSPMYSDNFFVFAFFFECMLFSLSLLSQEVCQVTVDAGFFLFLYYYYYSDFSSKSQTKVLNVGLKHQCATGKVCGGELGGSPSKTTLRNELAPNPDGIRPWVRSEPSLFHC